MTEKRKSHYPLTEIQAVAGKRGAEAFTKSALDGGRAMGLTSAEMLEVVGSLTRAEFYKSMTTLHDHRIWQDVYHAPTPVRIVAYIKLTLREGAVVISFKEKGT